MKIESKDKKQILISVIVIIAVIVGVNLCGRAIMNSQIYSHNDEVKKDVIDINSDEFLNTEDEIEININEEG